MAESTRAATAERALRDQLFNITTEKVVVGAADWILGEKLLSNMYKLTRETARKDNMQKKYYSCVEGKRARNTRRAKAPTAQRDKPERVARPCNVTLVVSIEYDDDTDTISSVVVARGSNKDPHTHTLRHCDLRNENAVLREAAQKMLDNSPKPAIVREHLRNNYAHIGGREAKYQTAYNGARDSLHYYRDKRDCLPRKDSLHKQLAEAVMNCKERGLHYNVFEIKTRRHSKKRGVVYASDEGLALLRIYSSFIAVDSTHNTNKARFILLNICIQDRNSMKRPVAYMLIQSQYSVVLAAGFKALSS